MSDWQSIGDVLQRGVLPKTQEAMLQEQASKEAESLREATILKVNTAVGLESGSTDAGKKVWTKSRIEEMLTDSCKHYGIDPNTGEKVTS